MVMLFPIRCSDVTNMYLQLLSRQWAPIYWGHDLDLLRSRDFMDHVTIPFAVCHLLFVGQSWGPVCPVGSESQCVFCFAWPQRSHNVCVHIKLFHHRLRSTSIRVSTEMGGRSQVLYRLSISPSHRGQLSLAIPSLVGAMSTGEW